MTKRPTSTVSIATKSGEYRIPKVDERNHLFDPVLSQNPCLQIINEDMAVLSVLWSDVEEIVVFRPTDITNVRHGIVIYERPSDAGSLAHVI